jgi:hypothetical protein
VGSLTVMLAQTVAPATQAETGKNK